MMEKYKILKGLPSLYILDESYGMGILSPASFQNRKYHVFKNLGLKTVTTNFIQKHIGRKIEEDGSVSAHLFNERVLVNIKEELSRVGFIENRLSERAYYEDLFEDSHTLPIDDKHILQEGVETHFRNKLLAIFTMLGEAAEITRFSSLKSTQKDIPFFIVNCKIRNQVNENLTGQSQTLIEHKIPEVTLFRIIQEGNNIELGFYPSEEYITEVKSLTRPVFPPDQIDGFCAVSFTNEGGFPSNIRYSIMEKNLLDAGAADNFIKVGNNEITMDIPCCYERGGIAGRAFESRLALVMRELSEYCSSRPAYRLCEKKPLSRPMWESVSKRLGAESTSLCSSIPDISTMKTLEWIEKSNYPNLFNHLNEFVEELDEGLGGIWDLIKDTVSEAKALWYRNKIGNLKEWIRKYGTDTDVSNMNLTLKSIHEREYLQHKNKENISEHQNVQNAYKSIKSQLSYLERQVNRIRGGKKSEAREIYFDCGDGNYISLCDYGKEIRVSQAVSPGRKYKPVVEEYRQILQFGRGLK